MLEEIHDGDWWEWSSRKLAFELWNRSQQQEMHVIWRQDRSNVYHSVVNGQWVIQMEIEELWLYLSFLDLIVICDRAIVYKMRKSGCSKWVEVLPYFCFQKGKPLVLHSFSCLCFFGDIKWWPLTPKASHTFVHAIALPGVHFPFIFAICLNFFAALLLYDLYIIKFTLCVQLEFWN